jgi:hypothetical protein
LIDAESSQAVDGELQVVDVFVDVGQETQTHARFAYSVILLPVVRLNTQGAVSWPVMDTTGQERHPGDLRVTRSR